MSNDLRRPSTASRALPKHFPFGQPPFSSFRRFACFRHLLSFCWSTRRPELIMWCLHTLLYTFYPFHHSDQGFCCEVFGEGRFLSWLEQLTTQIIIRRRRTIRRLWSSPLGLKKKLQSIPVLLSLPPHLENAPMRLTRAHPNSSGLSHTPQDEETFCQR
jgi:hypothetical protein